MLLYSLPFELKVLYKKPKIPITKKIYPEVRVVEICEGYVFHCYHSNQKDKYYCTDYLNGKDLFFTEDELQPTYYYSHSVNGVHKLVEVPQELLYAVDRQLKIQESYKYHEYN